jgi:septation ring formation regulator EzrA
MKYYTELSALEEQIFRVETLGSLFSLIAAGAEQSSPEDVRDGLFYIEGSLDDICEKLRRQFDAVWENVRNDEFAKMQKSEYNFEPLQAVVNNWVKS